MKKRIIYFIGLGLIIIGGILILIGAAVADFDPYVFSAGMIPTAKTVSFDRSEITSVSVRESGRVMVSIVPRRVDRVTVNYDESRFASQVITVENGELTLSAKNNVRWFDYLSIGGIDSAASVEVVIPDDLPVALDVSSDCRMISIGEAELTELRINENDGYVFLDGTTVTGASDISVTRDHLHLTGVTVGGNFFAACDGGMISLENCVFGADAVLSPHDSKLNVDLTRSDGDFTVDGSASDYTLTDLAVKGRLAVSCGAGNVTVQNVTCDTFEAEAKGYEKGFKYSFITDKLTAKSVNADLNCTYFSMTRPDIADSVTVKAWGTSVGIDGIDVNNVTVEAAETPVYIRSTGKSLDYSVAASTTGEGTVCSDDSRLTKSHKKIDVTTTNADVILLYDGDRVYTTDGDAYYPGASFAFDGGWTVRLTNEGGISTAVIMPFVCGNVEETKGDRFREMVVNPGMDGFDTVIPYDRGYAYDEVFPDGDEEAVSVMPDESEDTAGSEMYAAESGSTVPAPDTARESETTVPVPYIVPATETTAP